jgi:dTDP-4-dehydrorhamnose 3,5-epimerase
MTISEFSIPGPLLIEPQVYNDARGLFFESWNAATYREAGLDQTFVQDNHSRSAKNVLRGLHFQNPLPQGKLVRVVAGKAFDVVVDLRRSSEHFGQWTAVELSADKPQLFWVPEGFAHGFLAMEEGTVLLYKCTAQHAPEHEHTLAWDDPDLAIDWPLGGATPKLSTKDLAGCPVRQAPVFP